MSTALRAGRRKIAISNPDKLFFPEDGLTKADIVAYYRDISSVMFPHVKDRALTMQRFPDGTEGIDFFQKERPDYFPEWIPCVEVEKSGGAVCTVVCREAAALAYLANQAILVPHTWLSRVDKLNYPDQLIFDLDPPDEGKFQLARAAALQTRQALEELGLVPFVKSTGSRGLHVVVPLDRKADFDTVREFARRIADELAAREPEYYTTEHRKANRRGRLFIDVLRNAYAQTAVPAFSVRVLEGAPVAAPLHWEELEEDSVHARSFNVRSIFDRLDGVKDPWAGMARKARSLAPAARKLEDWLSG